MKNQNKETHSINFEKKRKKPTCDVQQSFFSKLLGWRIGTD